MSNKGTTYMTDEVQALLHGLVNTPLHCQDQRQKYAEQLIALRPDLEKGWNELSEILMRKQDTIGARAIAKMAIERFPEDVEALYNYAMSFFYQGGESYIPALFLLREVLRKDPYFPFAYYWLAEIYQINWEPAKAIPWLKHCLQLYPSYAAAASRLAVAYARVGDFSAAEDLAQHALAMNPDDTTNLTNAGMAFLYSGNLEKAMEVFQTALAIDPTGPYLNQQYVMCQRELLDREQRIANRRKYLPLGRRLKGTHRFFNEDTLTDEFVESLMGWRP